MILGFATLALALLADAPEPAKRIDELTKGTDKLLGLLTFYRSPDKLYLEVPRHLLDQPLGLAVILVNSVGDMALRGMPADAQVVRWILQGERLILKKENLAFRADPSSPVEALVDATFPDSPVFLAEVITPSDVPSPLLVDAKGLFGPDLAEILPSEFKYTTKIEDSWLVSLKVFPDNVLARVAYRFRRPEGTQEPKEGEAAQANPLILADPRMVEVTVDYHLYRLPQPDLRPRFEDERVGGFGVVYKDYTDMETRRSSLKHLLTRWNVKPSQPLQVLSPPIKPITFYIDRHAPAKWRPMIREAAQWWNIAFERIGIKDALRVLDQPDDPDWDPAELTHSMIYWNLADSMGFSGLAGPLLHDPRTGEVLRAGIWLNGEFFAYGLHRYEIYGETSPPIPPSSHHQNPRSALTCTRLPSFSSQIAFARLVLRARGILTDGSPEEARFMKQCFMELVAHEMGHALGFPHNMKASIISKYDDVAAGNVSGSASHNILSASVMDYNPVYLPPKHPPPPFDYFLTEIGPYDHLTVEYLYRFFPNATPEQEAEFLRAIAAKAETTPGLMYDEDLSALDPRTSTDDLGDDPLAFAEYRLTILRHELLPKLPELVLAEGHPYGAIQKAADIAVFTIAADYARIMARHVGGQSIIRRVTPAQAPGGPAPVSPLPPALQRRALEALKRHVFADGAFAMSPDALNQLKPQMLKQWNASSWRHGADFALGARIGGLYDTVLDALLEPARLSRILENERRMPAGADRFTLPELFTALEHIAFGSLTLPSAKTPASNARPSISADQRMLQRAVTKRFMKLALQPDKGTPAEATQLGAQSLRSILKRLDPWHADASRKFQDGYTNAHVTELAQQARRALNPVHQLPTLK